MGPIRYFANPVRAAQPAMAAGHLGMIVTPRQGNRLPEGVAWCADNGCGPTRRGKPGDAYPGDPAFVRFLDKHAPKAGECAFACAPDVLGDASATLERSAPMLPVIRELGYRAALVAQDGLEELEIPWDDFDALFIGGTTEWKMSPAAAAIVREAKARGKHVHFGRVNSRKRLRYAQDLGADSADGTYLVYGPDKNLPKLLGWLEELAAEAVPARAALDLAA